MWRELTDEYPKSGRGLGEDDPVGSSYDILIQNTTGDEVLRHETEDMMSMGSKLRRWNYVVFVEVLRRNWLL